MRRPRKTRLYPHLASASPLTEVSTSRTSPHLGASIRPSVTGRAIERHREFRLDTCCACSSAWRSSSTSGSTASSQQVGNFEIARPTVRQCWRKLATRGCQGQGRLSVNHRFKMSSSGHSPSLDTPHGYRAFRSVRSDTTQQSRVGNHKKSLPLLQFGCLNDGLSDSISALERIDESRAPKIVGRS